MVSKEDQQVVESLQEIQNLPKNGTVDKKSKKKVKAEAADSKQRTRSLSQADVHENVNLRAAFIHILGNYVITPTLTIPYRRYRSKHRRYYCERDHLG